METTAYLIKKNNKIILRMKQAGKSMDRTLKLPYYSKPKNTDERQTNRKSLLLANLEKDRVKIDSYEKATGLDYYRKAEMSFIDFYKEVVKKRGINNKNTRFSHELGFRRFVAYLKTKRIMDLKFKSLNVELIDDYRTFLLGCRKARGGELLSKSTMRKYFINFKLVVKEAYKKDYLRVDLLKDIDNIVASDNHHDYLTHKEVSKLLTTPNLYGWGEIPTRDFFHFSILSGMAHAEARNFKWIDINMEEEQWTFNYRRLKTNKKFKDIPLSPQAKSFLQRRLLNSKGSEYVFKNLRYNSYELIRLKKWCQIAGIEKKISLHCGRTTFATNYWLHSPNPSLETLRQLMGHGKVETTLIYIRANNLDMHKAVNAMPTYDETPVLQVA